MPGTAGQRRSRAGVAPRPASRWLKLCGMACRRACTAARTRRWACSTTRDGGGLKACEGLPNGVTGRCEIALDVHPRIAMQILRHSEIVVTMEVYTHVPSADTRRALRKLGEALGGRSQKKTKATHGIP